MRDGYYCSAIGQCQEGWCHHESAGEPCENFHRKYPTPEQFKEEYGQDYPDEGAAYGYYEHTLENCRYAIGSYGGLKSAENVLKIICACTPFVPDKNIVEKELSNGRKN